VPIVALGSRRLRAVVATVVLMLVCFAAGVAVADAQSPSRAVKAVRQAGVTVAELQAALGITADGVYGPQTRRAVRRFQRAHGLAVDGIAGPRTLEALGISARESSVRRGGRVAAILARIAECESGGDPTAVSANGRYFGKYQFSRPTWRAVGGRGNPARASEAEQDKRARILFRQRGTAPWPVCGAR
jgi:peptidoglycan hydrolase-like protein with peptidoglycan-binding domain